MKIKTLTFITICFLYLLLISCLASCTEEKSTSINENSESRIKLKEVRILNGHRYTIIEVDSIEFLTQSNGGFVRISK